MNSFFFNIIHGLAGRSRFLDGIGVFLAQYLGYVLILVAVIVFVRKKNWNDRFYFLAFVSLSVILSWGILLRIARAVYYMPRPFQALNFVPLIDHSVASSFPSGHAAAYFALAFAIYLFNKKLGWFFGVSALVMGIARIYCGVHWPLDIVGGAVFALGSVFIVKRLLPFVFKKNTPTI